MKYLRGFALFFFACLLPFAKAEETMEGEKIGLIPVFEKAFDNMVVDVIFDTATVTIEEAKKMGWKDEAFTEAEGSKGRVKISYPNAVFMAQNTDLDWYVPEKRSSYHTKEIRFYDSKGEIINRLALGQSGEEYVYLSPRLRYILVSRIPNEWYPNYTGGTVYDLGGKMIWETKGPTPIAVSDEGYTVAAYLDWQIPPETGGDFYVYDSEGKLLTTVYNPLKENTTPFLAKFSTDGEYAVLLFRGMAVPPTVIMLIQKTGQILWKKELKEYYFSGGREEIDIKADIGIIVAGSFLIDWRGNLKWHFPLKTGGNRNCIFSRDGSRVYIATTYGYLWCLNSENGKVIWKHQEIWSPLPGITKLIDRVPWFTEMHATAQNIVVKGTCLEWNKGEWYSTVLIAFDIKTGREVTRVEYPKKKIFISADDKRISIIDATKGEITGLRLGR